MKILNGIFSGGVPGDDIELSVFSTEKFFERTCGLLTLPKLHKGQALLLNNCRSIHTFGMRYMLDIIYINRANEIVKIVEKMSPYQISGCSAACHTLEMLGGEVSRLCIDKEMIVDITDGSKCES